QQSRGRRGDVVVEVGAVGHVHPGRAVLGAARLAAIRTRTGPHDRRLAEPAGQRDQLERDLLDVIADVLREHQDLSHCRSVSFPAQMNFCVARNSATLTPPSPSSLTTVPAWRGGRWACSTTSVAAPPSPTRAGSMPASASDIICTGFFFAAMMPLNDG